MTDRKPPLYQQALSLVGEVLKGRHELSRAVAPALFLADAILCALIIRLIPYTEIDWKAYMEQVSQFVSGERDYTKIQGGTGPLVYPAAHVYTYTGLYYLTNEGKNILLAQKLFAVLYVITLGVVMRCYRNAGVPPYVLPLLILSKRLHSIFVLRCFNDCFAVLFLFLTILAFQNRSWRAGILFYTWGLGIKMSLLLVLPAVGIILLLGTGFESALQSAAIIALVQVLIAIPFLANNPWGYLGRAFELSRQFFFKWTVNWRFMGEQAFLGKGFAFCLLALHILVLLSFITTRWFKGTGKSLPQIIASIIQLKSPFGPQQQKAVAKVITPEYVMTTILSANVIGLLFARSLHYQFYAYLAWSTPYLLYKSGAHPILQYVLWAAQEWAWNVYPSTPFSSGVVVGAMAVTVAWVWLGTKRSAIWVDQAKKTR
ncbi:family 58 putative glycosyltransferase [Triangularia verruculosa]|uniref:Dol-P-Man:Man(5)GlcNAc(2)-PP-Dol alpha-1,3-mannosyltransferase n=1 Tax=Triangularia verruculosa TaxID=2587418 RepID=A0AAN6XCR4_9PEZI|nr:family 58 putative glycosyltransferase [Triangularia verruculosa]